MRVPFVDLGAENAAVEDEISKAIARVRGAQRYILGPEVDGFEEALSERVGTLCAVGVSSGSDALFIALRALDVGPGDQVITSPFTFIATAESIARTGATPRFVDVSLDSFDLLADAVDDALSTTTRALIPVHLFGQAADVASLAGHAEAHGLAVVEDAAQSLGASLLGRAVGAWGRLGCFSFFPTKLVGALGDGGAIVTDDVELAERCRRLRQHGSSEPDLYTEVGGNFRLDALQAAILRVKLSVMDNVVRVRREHAAYYMEQLSDVEGVVLPTIRSGSSPTWSLFTVRVLDNRRDELLAYLTSRNVETRVYYRRPLHLQPAFASLRLNEGQFPNAERACGEVLSLPIYPTLSHAQQDHVIDSIRQFFGQ